METISVGKYNVDRCQNCETLVSNVRTQRGTAPLFCSCFYVNQEINIYTIHLFLLFTSTVRTWSLLKTADSGKRKIVRNCQTLQT